jgi:hypothetical protein
MLPSTKNFVLILGVEKNGCRKILHVLKDSNLFLNKWFRTRDIGYAKV